MNENSVAFYEKDVLVDYLENHIYSVSIIYNFFQLYILYLVLININSREMGYVHFRTVTHSLTARRFPIGNARRQLLTMYSIGS